MKNALITGDRFEGVLLQTFIGKGSTRPRVRPLEYFEENIRVEFPRALRDENSIGTRFRGDLKVSQKTKNGKPYGKKYLVVTDKSIEIVQEFTPMKNIKAVRLNTASDRSYEFIDQELKREPKLISFIDLRKNAYENSKEALEVQKGKAASSYNRSDLIKTYALTRSRGRCEGCNASAPFLKRNGQPYLEVHHMTELSDNGHDSPLNVISLCPNCHARVTHGKDGKIYNDELKQKIIILEKQLNE